MTASDALMERGANRLQRLANRAAAAGGVGGRLAEPLAEDAALLRRMKPSLIVARAKGGAPTDLEPRANVLAPRGPQLGKPARKRGGANLFLVIASALAVGVALAKFIDWRGHVHPRD